MKTGSVIQPFQNLIEWIDETIGFLPVPRCEEGIQYDTQDGTINLRFESLLAPTADNRLYVTKTLTEYGYNVAWPERDDIHSTHRGLTELEVSLSIDDMHQQINKFISKSQSGKPITDAKTLIKSLEKKYGFTHNDRDYLRAVDPEILQNLGDNGLVFNYEGDFITECEEPEEGDPSVEEIYQFIRLRGWSLKESPIDEVCWMLYPTHQLQSPIKSLIDM